MSYEDIIGNRSVHWRMVYEDARGRPGQAHQEGKLAEGGNATHELRGNQIRGRDSVLPANIGRREKASGEEDEVTSHRGKFRVRMRFERLDQTNMRVVEESGMYVLVVDVPALTTRSWDAAEADQPNPLSEVRIEW